MLKELKFLETAVWHCEPPSWSVSEEAGLYLETGNKTDFWQDTYYGFHRDDGHFFGASIEADFTATLEFEGFYKTLYDQAGLMIRRDHNNWVKAGIEFSDKVTNFSIVVTRSGRSDWSVIARPNVSGLQKVRLTHINAAVLAHYLGEDGRWHLMRVADFPNDTKMQLGPMACSPQREGFAATFKSLHVTLPISSPLHEE